MVAIDLQRICLLLNCGGLRWFLVFLVVGFPVEVAAVKFCPARKDFGFKGDGVEVGVLVFQTHGAVCRQFKGVNVCFVGQVELLVV